tara:strand:- start:3468 stop:4694 length:1227 start_codon:yes stop_codon:yes gene_type:complete
MRIFKKNNKKITIAAVPYSPNLGDGIIHEALVYSLCKYYKELQINTIDISGRLDYLEHKKKFNVSSLFLNYLVTFPKSIRLTIIYIYIYTLYVFKLKKYYSDIIAKTETLIIGGGQLFSDVDLNFPLKLHLLFRQVKRHKKNVIIYGVGVSSTVSGRGKNIFSNLLNNSLVKYIFLRDKISINNLLNFNDISKQTEEVWDPGILISDKYPEFLDVKKDYIAINITSPVNLKYSGDSYSKIDFDTFYYKVILFLINNNEKRVLLFTNGSFEDEEYKVKLYNYLKKEFKDSLMLSDRPLRPVELIQIIAKSKFIISHRLHANIIAYSYKIPSIGIVWDKKVLGFFKKINREEMALDLNNFNWYDNIIKLFKNINDFKINDTVYRKNIAEARVQIKKLALKIKENEESINS